MERCEICGDFPDGCFCDDINRRVMYYGAALGYVPQEYRQESLPVPDTNILFGNLDVDHEDRLIWKLRDNAGDWVWDAEKAGLGFLPSEFLTWVVFDRR